MESFVVVAEGNLVEENPAVAAKIPVEAPVFVAVAAVGILVAVVETAAAVTAQTPVVVETASVVGRDLAEELVETLVG